MKRYLELQQITVEIGMIKGIILLPVMLALTACVTTHTNVIEYEQVLVTPPLPPYQSFNRIGNLPIDVTATVSDFF